MPQGILAEELQTIICGLAQKYDGKIFPPHVTILGAVPGSKSEAIKKTKLLAERINPCTLMCDQLATGDESYRSFFIRMKKTEEVLSMFEEARMISNHTDFADHMPHLSLYYGECSPEQKETMRSELNISLQQSFVVDALYLYDTSGDPQDWKPVIAVPIKQRLVTDTEVF